MLSQVSSIDRDRWSELAALASCILLGLLALWLVVRLVWLLIPRGDGAIETPPARVGGGADATRSAVSIAKWHLFGNTPYSRVAGPNAPATTLSLVLRGTLAERDPHAGIAVVDIGQGREQAFHAGAEIASGVTLAEVWPDHIVLVHDGAQEVLNLPRDGNLVPGDIVQPTPGRAIGGAAAALRGASDAGANATSSVATPAVSRNTATAPAWQQAMNKLRVNPEALIDRVKLVPVLDNGKLTGVRLNADAALLSKAGLRTSDIVTAVNGVPIDSVERGRQVVDSLKNAGSARVTVLREGKPTEITVDLSQDLQ